jgi:endonuclease-3
MTILTKEVQRLKIPWVTEDAHKKHNPFRVLISTMLSLRTKDEVTAKSSQRLFDLAATPRDMLRLSEKRIAKTIFPVGFYNVKAKNIRTVCRILIKSYGGRVPDDIDQLLKLPGVGRKTANLVVTLGYAKPGICVDTHVHRITNRWGYIKTRTPDQTEQELRKNLPKCYWIPINSLLVAYGQNVCTPLRPKCTQCKLNPFCSEGKQRVDKMIAKKI